MNIYEALNKIDFRFKEYFKYKHPDLRFDHSKPLKSEEDLLRLTARKTMSGFYRWEKSSEYKHLLMLYLDYKIAQDYEQIYEIVSEKAKQGDDKSIRIFLSLQKDISQNSKSAAKLLNSDDIDDYEEENGLDLT